MLLVPDPVPHCDSVATSSLGSINVQKLVTNHQCQAFMEDSRHNFMCRLRNCHTASIRHQHHIDQVIWFSNKTELCIQRHRQKATKQPWKMLSLPEQKNDPTAKLNTRVH